MGDLIRKARGTQELPKTAGSLLDLGNFQIPEAVEEVNAVKGRDLS